MTRARSCPGRWVPLRLQVSIASSASSVCKSSMWTRDIEDRKNTRLNSSHSSISYAVFCLKKKNNRRPLHHLHEAEHYDDLIAQAAAPAVTHLERAGFPPSLRAASLRDSRLIPRPPAFDLC